ncbi:response regulator [Rhabdochromatium marinum]|uniref:response regulator n=1 Tax=Rhabdochromatium marinum TaxID=48729 RepID=UPI00190334BE|nr:response regulator [Rhabdochromatium marinum]MBK1650066.1 hypothetical protein [Rhabdochromatium marinum]
MRHTLTRRAISVLCITDGLDVLHRLERALREASFDPDMRQITTESAFSAALEHSWQTVICTTHGPKFDALSALQRLRHGPEHCADLPFLMLVAPGMETLGLQAMDSGANDYLTWDALVRLGPALRRELQQANLRRQARATAAHHQALQATSFQAILYADAAGQITTFNQGAEATFGYRAEEMLGQPLTRLLPQDILTNIEALPDSTAGKQQPRSWLSYGIYRDGNQFPLDVSAARLRLDGQAHYILTLHDRSNILVTETALWESERRFQRLTAHIKDFAIFMLDLQGRIMTWNSGAQALLGYPSAEVLGRRFSIFYTPEDHANDRPKQLLKQAIAEGRAEYEGWRQRRDGSYFYARGILSAVCSTTGEPIGLVKIEQDLSERKAIENQLKAHNLTLEARVHARTRELETAKQTAEQLARAKSEFLANMSHEIRTPMHVVLGLTHVLSTMTLPGAAAEKVNKIHAASQSLLSLLDDILDFSKIEAGKISLECVPIDLAQMLDHLAVIMATAAAGKALDINLIPPIFAKDCVLMGDALRLMQVLINLASNAIKFTTEGLIEVRITPVEHHPDALTLHFAVTDTGIGIDASAQRRLFEPFTQAAAATARHFGGTGLGLTISRHLVRMMGGELEVSSQPGRGSTFSFSLRFDTQPRAAKLGNSLLDLQLLIADDCPNGREALQTMLGFLGWSAESLHSGHALLERVLCDPALHSPQVVLLIAASMSDLGGIEVVRQLQAQLPPNQRPILVLIQTSAQPATDPANGCDAGLTKPIGPELLRETIIKAYNDRFGGEAHLYIGSQAHPLQGVRILLVDDSEINLEVTRDILSTEGAMVRIACGGQTAINWLAAHPHDVDLVLMDIQMPGVNGLEATRRIRKIRGLEHLPILAQTAGTLKEQRQAALAAGMNDLIAKPFDIEHVVQLILEYAPAATEALSAAADPPTKPSATLVRHSTAAALSASSAPVASASDESTVLPYIDLSCGVTRFGHRNSYHHYLGRFMTDQHSVLETLTKGAMSPTEARSIVHGLRGLAGNLGLTRVAASAARLDDQLACGGATAQDHQQVRDDLYHTLTAIREYLSAQSQETGTEILYTVHATPLDQDRMHALFTEAITGLRNFSPRPAEQVLMQLEGRIGQERLSRIHEIRQSLLEFRFEAAIQILETLAKELDVTLKP